MNTLDKIVEKITHKNVYIQTHNFPDPDAISSAFGLQKLLEHRGISSTICYKGKIDRYSTMRMIELLGISIYNLDELAELDDKAEIILVDAQKGNANIIDMAGNEIICIDHHPTFEDAEYRFSDIRPEVGACASIIASYYFESDIPMDKNVATALVFGLRVDTANLCRGLSPLDMDMFYTMSDICDNKMVTSLGNNTIHYNELTAYAHAINSIKVYDDVSFANTGKECPEPLIATVSDFILSLVEVRFSIVYSIKKDGIKLSVRNEKPELDAGKIAYIALKDIGSGGGHEVMAGGFVPFDGFTIDDEEKIGLLIDVIEERFLNTIAQFAK